MSDSEDIKQIKATLYGNGKKGLVTLTSNLYEKVELLSDNIDKVQCNVEKLVRFQTQTETEKELTEKKVLEIEELKNKQILNKRWFVGLTTTVILALIGTIITLITTIPKSEPEGLSEDEFKNMWNEYKKDHKTRDAEIDSTYSALYINYDG